MNTQTDFKPLIVVFLFLFLLTMVGCAGKKAAAPLCPDQETLAPGNGLPSILVIGDSISIGYTPTLETSLVNYDVVHNPCNAMETSWTTTQIDTWLNSRQSFEAITFNNGLWDIADWVATTPAVYQANLHYIAQKIKAKTQHPLFILTTQVLPNTPDRLDADVVDYNQLASQVMSQEGIPVLDLYSVSATIPQDHIDPNNVHYTPQGYQVLGQAVLNELNNDYGIN